MPRQIIKRISAPVHRRQVLALAAGVWGCAAFVACIQHPIAEPPPEFRGIVITGPPPSFADATWLDIGFRGELRPSMVSSFGTTVNVWDEAQGQGVFTVTTTNTFEIPHLGLDPRNNCLGLWAENTEESTVTESYQIRVELDSAACVGERCTPTDAKGACVCLYAAKSGCYEP
jgi:hypothetical protein